MKKLLSLGLLFGSLVLNAEVFDYNLWAKDLQTLIELNKTSSTLQGDDTNHNQVRDDVENYIKKKFSGDEFQKIMFLEAARKIQQIITLPKEATVQTHKKLDDELLQIYTCRDFIIFKHSDANVQKSISEKSEFKEQVLNTTKRLQAYISHKQKIPFKLSIPSDGELKRQKDSCEKLYSKIKSESKKTTTLTAK